MNDNQREAIENLEEAQGYIDQAISCITVAKNLAPSINGYAGSYTIPWLEKFKNDEHQPGNIQELIGIIENREAE